MRLKVFTRKDNRAKGRSCATLRTIHVIGRNTSCLLSTYFSREIAKSEGNTNALLAFDTGSKNDWYVAFGKFNEGFNLLHKKGLTANQSGYSYFCCGDVARKFLAANKAKNSCLCLVSEKTMEIDGIRWYKIVTSKPVRSK